MVFSMACEKFVDLLLDDEMRKELIYSTHTHPSEYPNSISRIKSLVYKNISLTPSVIKLRKSSIASTISNIPHNRIENHRHPYHQPVQSPHTTSQSSQSENSTPVTYHTNTPRPPSAKYTTLPAVHTSSYITLQFRGSNLRSHDLGLGCSVERRLA